MKDKILLNVEGLINSQKREEDKNNTSIICSNFLRFCYEKKLLVCNPFDSANINNGIIIKESNLTGLGMNTFQDLLFDWLKYTDNENGKLDRKNNLKMLEKYYKQIVKDF